ncbi:hypothetical protein FOV72_19760 [Gordonia rubripertincta]|uniref:hypothetical protein n=1 Tax=Gordonia rubripertincta TaxID=36822 RepID=UPI00117C0F2C|nr:hypothetical protein [Gordonia rubripertincta]TSD93499.1 hypothetical protein FOV72_19760 [Gordonia rubripertincta]
MPSPRKPRTKPMNMRQPDEIRTIAAEQAAKLAAETGLKISMSAWVAAAIAEKAGRPDLIPPKLRQGVMDLQLGA